MELKRGREIWNRFLMYLIMEMKHSFHQTTVKRHSCGDLTTTVSQSLYNQLKKHYDDCEGNEEEKDNNNYLLPPGG